MNEDTQAQLTLEERYAALQHLTPEERYEALQAFARVIEDTQAQLTPDHEDLERTKALINAIIETNWKRFKEAHVKPSPNEPT